MMRAGAGLMQIQAGIPRELVDLLQATILFFLVASPVITSHVQAARRQAEPGRQRDRSPMSYATRPCR